MAAAYDDDSAATSSGEVDDLLDLFEGLRADVEFGAGLEGLGPGFVDVVGLCAERDGGFGFGDFALDGLHVGEGVVWQEGAREEVEGRGQDIQPQVFERVFIMAMLVKSGIQKWIVLGCCLQSTRGMSSSAGSTLGGAACPPSRHRLESVRQHPSYHQHAYDLQPLTLP